MNYIPIRLNTLRPDVPVFFDLFIHIADKQIHYIKKNEIFDSHRLTKLRIKGVKKLFVSSEEEESYLKYLDECLNTLSQKNIELSKRGEMSYDTLVTDAENAERNLETEKSYAAVKGRVSKIIDFLGSEQGTLKSILEAAGCALDNHQHAANVSSLATGLALRVGGISPREVGDLALAALLHDLGKSKLGFTGPIQLNKLTPQQVKDYKKHPEKAVELLSSKKYVTPTILRLIIEHEELADGKGYPERKSLGGLSVTSQILSLCNQFDSYSMATQTPPTQAIKAFFEEKSQFFDLDHLAMLGDLLAGK